MTDFTFILSSVDHRSLDKAVQLIDQSLSSNNTTLHVTVQKAVTENDVRSFGRKLVVDSNDVHVMQKIQRIDLPQGVQVKALA